MVETLRAEPLYIVLLVIHMGNYFVKEKVLK